MNASDCILATWKLSTTALTASMNKKVFFLSLISIFAVEGKASFFEYNVDAEERWGPYPCSHVIFLRVITISTMTEQFLAISIMM